MKGEDRGGYRPRGDNREQWGQAAARFDDADASLKILGKPVMERWEEPFMGKLASIACSNGGRVLEVGFGLGISASFVQRHPIDEHVIIEANAEVFERLLEFQRAAKVDVSPHRGLWEDVVDDLPSGGFDGILYDTYPLAEDDLHVHQFRFVERALGLLKPGGVMTYCNLTSWGNLKGRYPDDEELFEATQRPHLEQQGWSEIGFEIFRIDPPEDCEYYAFPTVIAPRLRR
ncbi:MAG: class I SAM-dependent methyltransferase [bacterium]|nr:class I SAM-dependent methyltransferase [bacterium]